MLTTIFPHDLSWSWCKICRSLLAFVWCLGLVFGVLIADLTSDILVPLMHRTMVSPLSISGLLIKCILPFLLSAFAVYYYPPIVLIICASKAFCFAFCQRGISLAFGERGWLIGFFFLFTDIILLPVLYLFWIRMIQGSQKLFSRDLGLCLIIASVVGIIDLYLISPFLGRII